MKFNRPVKEIIEGRSSWRTYKAVSLNEDDRMKIQSILHNSSNGPFGNKVRFRIADSSDQDSSQNQKLGTYGIIKGAKTFIVGAIKNEEKSLEDLGYLLEALILYASDMGLGTCWLGGTFNRSKVGRMINLGPDEMTPAITPVGYKLEKRGFIDAAVRFAAGSKKRKPWNDLFFVQNMRASLDKAEAGNYSIPLEMVRLAPSASNKQPWIIVKNSNSNTFHFYLKRSAGYAKALKYDIQRVDMGIAMCHFELAAKEQGLSGQWAGENPEINTEGKDMEYIVSWKA